MATAIVSNLTIPTALPIGASTKTFGPRTDEAAWALLLAAGGGPRIETPVDPKPTVETDTLTYFCQCGKEFPVLAERENGGEWVIVSGDDERCPSCGQWGICELDYDPDVYWGARGRSGDFHQPRDENEPTREAWHAELWTEYQANAL